MFISERTRLINDIIDLENIIDKLQVKRNNLDKKNKVSRQGYDFTICNLLATIRELSEKMVKGVGENYNSNQNSK